MTLIVDAVFFMDTLEIGIGMVIRNDEGVFVSSRVLHLPQKLRVDEDETMDLLEALSWIKGLRLDLVIVEVDAKMMHDALKVNTPDDYVFGDFLSACKSILVENPFYHVRLICRSANEITHHLARALQSFLSPHCWIEPPTIVDNLFDIICTYTI
ncbi:hypothetical protein ACS0TY_012002 [Phlomoides rotata]